MVYQYNQIQNAQIPGGNLDYIIDNNKHKHVNYTAISPTFHSIYPIHTHTYLGTHIDADIDNLIYQFRLFQITVTEKTILIYKEMLFLYMNV